MRKAIVVLCALLIIALLIGCAAPKEAPEKKEAKDTEDKQAEEVEVEEKEIAKPKAEETPEPEAEEELAPEKEETTPAPTEVEPIVEKSSELSAELKELFEKSKRVQSMTYLRAGPETENRFLNTHNVKGKYIRIDLYPVDAYKIDEYFDTVYLDTEAKTATARCREKKRCISRDTDNTKKIFNVSYSAYRLKTPYEWIKEVDYAEIVGPEVLDGRSVIKIKYSDDGAETEMWVDESYGVALKVRKTYADASVELHQFKDFYFNSLSDEDVVPEFT